MLVEFSVSNYKSIREQQTLKLTSVKAYKEHPSNVFSIGIEPIELLHSVAIYGANSAGKSSLLEALNYMERFILMNNKMTEGEQTDTIPYKLDDSSFLEPSTFEVIFIENGIRYQYGFAVDQEQIVSEWLYATPKKLVQKWIERDGQDKGEWIIHRNLAKKSDRDTWKRFARNNSLLLAVAVQLNADSLKPVFNWFRSRIVTLSNESFSFTADKIQDKSLKDIVIRYLNSADLSIIDLNVHEKNVSIEDLNIVENDIGNLPVQLREAIENGEIKTYNVIVKHKENQREWLNLKEESDGTKQLFALAMPLIDILQRGRVVYIDELNNSLHPHIVKMIINLFNNSETNPNHAQLIFTSHDTSILTRDIFRRDQIWFVEKDDELTTQLYPISDFCPRPNESLGKGYLEGKYGAVPFIGDFNWV